MSFDRRDTLRIEEMYAFVQLDPADNTEGIIAFLAPNGVWMPMVGADMKRIEQLRPWAKETAQVTRRPVRLLRFTNRLDVEMIEP